jgi:palmitoyl-protein thioesterase
MVRLAALAIVAVQAESELPPSLQALVDLATNSPEEAAKLIAESPLAAIASEIAAPQDAANADEYIPTVVAHGMGDSCFNRGMKSITKGVGTKTGQYSTCIGTAGNWIADTVDGFLKNMDKSIEFFADKIKNDPKLANGFNCVGFSQGNSLCRGYIQKYNNPPVNSFMSVHGTVMGVSAFPSCFKQEKPLGLVCKALADVLGDAAYIEIIQDILFQADYYRHNVGPDSKTYLKNSQLAHMNNENPDTVDPSINANFAKTNQFVMVKAAKDSMVYPNENEHWGAMDDVPNANKILSMKETKFYKEDLFGLKTADEAGKIHFEQTEGDHLQFTSEQLYGWIETYWKKSAVEV